MKIGRWSTTAANNNATPPDGWPEGQAPSTVNDCARATMAAIKTALRDMEWFDHDFTPTFVNANSFTLSGDQTIQMVSGRSLKLYDGSTIYRSIGSASFTVVTTVSLDAGTAITSSLSSFATAIINPANPSYPKRLSTSAIEVTGILSASGVVLTGNLGVAGTISASAMNASSLDLPGHFSCSAANVSSSLSIGTLVVLNNADVAGYLSASAGQVTGALSLSAAQVTADFNIAGTLSVSAVAVTGNVSASGVSILSTLTGNAIVATSSLQFYPWCKISATVGGVTLGPNFGFSAASRVSTGVYRLKLLGTYNVSAAAIIVNSNISTFGMFFYQAYGSADAIEVRRVDLGDAVHDGSDGDCGIGITVYF